MGLINKEKIKDGSGRPDLDIDFEHLSEFQSFSWLAPLDISKRMHLPEFCAVQYK